MIEDDPIQALHTRAARFALDSADSARLSGVRCGAVDRVFAHWVFMLMRHPARTALGPKRVAKIEWALELYAEDVLLMAIEGCAASAWHAGANDRHRCFQDLELILRDEAHIERFADDGARLRERVERMAVAEVAQVVERAQMTPESVQAASAAAEAARERMRQVALKLRSGGS